MQAPAVFAGALCRHVDADIALLGTVLHAALQAAERADLSVGLEALPGEPVLHREIDGPTERVEAKHRVVGPEVRSVDRVGRDEIPVDGVAERFVDAHAIHVDREALRGAWYRR